MGVERGRALLPIAMEPVVHSGHSLWVGIVEIMLFSE